MIENNKPRDNGDQTAKPLGSEVIAPERQMRYMRRAVKENFSRKIQAMLNSCINCGLCAESCHYYCSTGDSEVIPVNKSAKLARMLQTHFHPVKSRLPFFKRLHPVCQVRPDLPHGNQHR
jgi:ferredoxin